jgi:hypothetical protein
MSNFEGELDLERLVTIETFSSPWQAQLARTCLESEGIHAVVADEHFYRLYGALSGTMGGVKLQVRPEEAQRASELLRNRVPIPEIYLVTEEDLRSEVHAADAERALALLDAVGDGMDLEDLEDFDGGEEEGM